MDIFLLHMKIPLKKGFANTTDGSLENVSQKWLGPLPSYPSLVFILFLWKSSSTSPFTSEAYLKDVSPCT